MKIFIFSMCLLASFTLRAVEQPVALWQQSVEHTAPVVEKANRLSQIAPVMHVDLNSAILEQLIVGDTLLLPMLKGVTTLTVSQINQHTSDIRSVVADSAEGSAVLTVSGRQFFASFSHNGQRYSAQGLDGKVSVFKGRDITPANPGAERDYRIPEHRGDKTQVTFDVQPAIATDDDPARLDILIYYTASSDALYSGDATPRIYHMITVANQIFADSDVAASLNPVKLIKVEYPQTQQVIALSELESGTVPFTDVHSIRFEQGGDLVTLIQPHGNNDTNCGLANLADPRANSQYRAFSVNAIDCDDYVLAHEVGHNLGLHHSRRQDGRGFSEPYALGYGVNDDFVTVMAYEHLFFTGGQYYPDKIYRFSNPQQLCNGQPCGIAHPDPDSADAALALRQSVKAAEARFSDSPDLTTVTEALAKIESSALRHCIERNLDHKAKYAANAVSYLSCTNEPISSLEGLQYFSGLKDLSLYNITTADPTPLSNLTQLYSLSIELSELEDYSFISQMPLLQSLRLDRTRFNQLELLADLPLLEKLELFRNSIDFSRLPQLNQLKWLDLLDSDLFNLDFIHKVPNLTFLSIQYNSIQSLQPLTGMRLQTLYAANNKITDLSPLSAMTTLRNLYVGYNLITDVTPVSGMRIYSLSLSGNRLVSFVPLAQMTQLTRLYIENTGLTDLSLIDKMTNLEYLVLGYDDIRDFSPLLPMITRYGANYQRIVSLYFDYDKPMDCWQKEYLTSVAINTRFQLWPEHCKRGNDSLDFDRDGMSNRYEVDNGFNPYDSKDGQMRKLRLGMQDFDGDGKADIALRDAPAFGNYILQSSNNKVRKTKFGQFNGDIPLAADFDGDGITDIAMRRPKDFMWYVLNSSDGQIQRVKFGLASQDIPVVADYDGDGKADIAVFRPSQSMWYVLQSSNNETVRLKFGYSSADTPVVGDFDGDGKADFVLRRGGTGSWYMQLSGNSADIKVQVYGRPDDVPVAADYDGDGKTDLGLYRRSNNTWYQLNSNDSSRTSSVFVNVADGIPVVQDYDGDGKADIALRNPANYTQYILQSSTGVQRTVKFGLNKNYIPFAAIPAHKSGMLGFGG